MPYKGKAVAQAFWVQAKVNKRLPVFCMGAGASVFQSDGPMCEVKGGPLGISIGFMPLPGPLQPESESSDSDAMDED